MKTENECRESNSSLVGSGETSSQSLIISGIYWFVNVETRIDLIKSASARVNIILLPVKRRVLVWGGKKSPRMTNGLILSARTWWPLHGDCGFLSFSRICNYSRNDRLISIVRRARSLARPRLSHFIIILYVSRLGIKTRK